MMSAMRVGIADHFGWAVAVTANDRHEVVDRRRIELIEPGMHSAPVHHGIEGLDDAAAAAFVADARASAARATAAALDELGADLRQPVASISLRVWPEDFPQDIAVQRQVPWEARADGIMYRQVLAEVAAARGWPVCGYVAKDVLDLAAAQLGARADEVLVGPKAALGPPWTKDHRVALAATVMAGVTG